jgi:hypothetical protein
MAALPPVRILGVGDLKVVKQRLARYEAGEIAHVENIMSGERRSRFHRRFRRIEEINVNEQERIEESKRDLESTERFELQSETQKTVRSESKFEAGLNVSGGFGPVKVSAFANFSLNSSNEESALNAINYAKEVVDKSVSRLQERVYSYRSTKSVEETEEKNKHAFTNDGADHVVGTYHWVDKYYRAKVVNYGKRLFFEFMVPEPSVFFRYAQQASAALKGVPVKPAEPKRPSAAFPYGPTTEPLSPSDISRENYLALVKQHGAQGMEPPPPEAVHVDKGITREFNPAGRAWSITEDFAVPEGYTATALYGLYSLLPGGGPATFQIMAGGGFFLSPAKLLEGQRGAVAITISGSGWSTLNLSTQMFCELAPEYYQQWQLKTYAAIMASYNKALLDYEEQLAAAEIQAGVRIAGRNPTINREIERRELKRACLRLWADTDVALPDAMVSPPGNPPRDPADIHRVNAINNSRIISFFEKCFDWQNMSYEFFPYYWGRRSTWAPSFAYEDPDPLFEAFLRAGAARVVVPVDPVYNRSVIYYQLGGPIGSSNLPDLSQSLDPDAILANSYLLDLESTEDVILPGGEIDIDKNDSETWMIKVPTTLVWLSNPQSPLPNFEP